MTTVLKLSDVTLPGNGYPKLRDFVVPDFPVKNGLVGLYRFGYSLEASCINHANSDLPLTVIGTPTINDFGCELSRNNCFDTGFTSTDELTVLAVAKPKKYDTNAVGALLVSNFTNADGGDSLGFAASQNFRAWVSSASGSVTAGAISMASAVETDWNFFACVGSAGAESKPVWGRNATLTIPAGNVVADRSVITSRTLRIGGHYSTVEFAGTCEIALMAIFTNMAMADADITANYEYLRSVWAPAVGIETL